MDTQVKVQVILNDIVKPSCPTPSDRKTLTLSFLDESFPTIHIPSIILYTGNESTKPPLIDNIITILKSSLSETLTHFYPLAGRLENEYTVSCNDQGIPFIVTRVNCKLVDVLNSNNKLNLFTEFLPPESIISLGDLPITELVSLAVQINFFECGGVAIGSYGMHKLLDAVSMSNFLDYWPACARKSYNELVKPDFDSIIKLFPPLPEEKRVKISNGSDSGSDSNTGLSKQASLPIKVVAKSFKFKFDVIKELKAIALSETVPIPTTFEAVVGFVIKYAIDAVLNSNNGMNNIGDALKPAPVVLAFGATLRPRTNPPLSKQCMGNLSTNLLARLSDDNGNPGKYEVKDIVREIHATVQTVNQKLEALQGENAGEIHIANKKAEFQGTKKEEVTKFIIFNWCKLGYNKIDFGFGKPLTMIPVGKIYPFLRNTIMLVEYSDPNNGEIGIEVYVCLEEKQMPFLEANSNFLAFATPS